MVFLNSRISIDLRTSPAVPIFSPKFPIPTFRIPSVLNARNSRYIPFQRAFSLHLLQPAPTRKFQISARFRRPTNRPNYLRKKFTQHQRQLQQVTPLHEFDKIDMRESEFDTPNEENKNTITKRFNLENEPNFDSSSDIHEERSSHENENENDAFGAAKESETESKGKQFGESIMWNKLENWVEQYKKDSEFWGIGTGPVFTVFQDSEGKIERVVVNEDEIFKRSRVDPLLDRETDDFSDVTYKISFAKDLAREMENGGNAIPKNTSVAKFLVSNGESSFMGVVRSLTWNPRLFSRMSKVGVGLLCSLLVVWAIKGLFGIVKDDKKYTALEKEMLRRKVKARAEREKIFKGSVEVMEEPVEPKSASFRRPQLDKKEVLNKIVEAKRSNSELAVVEGSQYQDKEFMNKIEEIRSMARHAREIEKRDSAIDGGDGEDLEAFSSDDENQENEIYVADSGEATGSTSSIDPDNDTGRDIDESSAEEMGTHSLKKNLRIIKSAKEAREYLARKHQRSEMSQEPEVKNDEQNDIAMASPGENLVDQTLHVNTELGVSSPLSERMEVSYSSKDCSKDSVTRQERTENLDYFAKSDPEICDSNQDSGRSIFDISGEQETREKESQGYDCGNDITSYERSMEDERGGLIGTEAVSPALDNSEGIEYDERDFSRRFPGTNTSGEVNDRSTERTPSPNEERWIEKNFHEIEPIVQKISAGFRDNYLSAREKANLDSKIELMQQDDNGSELEWMKDERLTEIVFRVRDNELSGRDPFHLMTEEDKCAFFTGLEKKIVAENEKLKNLHEYFHSNIENLDYGADGISLYDPPEKILPRWKVPPVEQSPEFLNKFVEQRQTAVTETLKNSFLTKKTGDGAARKSPKLQEKGQTASDVSDKNSSIQEKDLKISSKTIIEGSDGSVRAGKKSGREFWEHTKKWSQGFLESYNAETDPEVKSVMKDIGKDLDRWITEKEIKEAAELMDKLPEKGQKFVKEKLEKVRREMELFGPQAVVSKYCEYAEEKEDDCLWWLDLPIVLCIELYTIENGEQRVGFYSLEMAADLELDPKQYHVIAFEDASDCKNLCYIIQTQMELLGNGNAFVVARPPKDAFREAKANGFSVTVIRKGQLQLNVDQTLEEVEELIIEIGSKIYHDKIMKERSVDINGLMKGVFGFSKPAKSGKRKSKRKLKKRSKP